MPLNGINYITIASDASCGKERTGFAYYIRDDDGTEQHAWYVDEVMPSHEAETIAMQGAITALLGRNIKENTKVIYYCDNTTVLRMIDNSFTKSGKKYKHITEQLQKDLEYMTVETRHVKGHTSKQYTKGAEKRYYLNDWCDKNARAMMRHKRLHQYRNWREEKKDAS